ncbi:DUF3604 domain-containing protein [Alteraurantiacibacter aquimixticola]|uniref:DUF3604 domain-containing protein n=1 Tax=Alteraurantiacibacter aquimixticola TaxID=2489173 RepID=A0A4T3EY57_9SPHN|nr:DUF3604 domain-containing protein [Alteraurantiacibacter aquimixticola]TIX49536.1 DUF3604 domain-containing protein [Alteraurantiacibacter aquimixticola]
MMRLLFATAATLALSACNQADAPAAAAQSASVTETAPATMPVGDRVLLWGDTHVHSINSIDAFSSGTANADIDSAYRFARGIPVIFPRTGQKVQIDRPLDFLVMADHAVGLAVSSRIAANDPSIMEYPIAQRLRELLTEEGGRALTTAAMGQSNLTEEERAAFMRDMRSDEVMAGSWQGQIDAAERHNRPGEFTALIGWEWTFAPALRNMHRVVFTNAGGDVASQFLPLANYQTEGPEDLYAYFEQTRTRTGADFVAIPHNSNLSEGRMFELTDKNGDPFDAAYAELRNAWEPVVEITQYKGSSETHPALSPNDEFADFELRNMLLTGVPTDPLGGSYLRSALLRGMAEQSRIGVNPFQYGIIGASDSHTGFSSQEESNFLGKLGEDYLPKDRLGPDAVNIIFPSAQMSASGLAGVWADRNDRQSIFDAFRRREVYGTSGPRMSLRLFAGYGFAASDVERRDFAHHGYRMGVPMGGNLLPANGRVPQLAIRAVKDPEGANLDRVQVVKGWIGTDGEMHERIYNVAWSAGRSLRTDGSLPDVGNTVDLATARYTNSIGAAELATLWTDPDFDPAERAFYYVRVIEIPTPRHHLFDALALGIDPASIDITPTIQERAWSSPVWYNP